MPFFSFPNKQSTINILPLPSVFNCILSSKIFQEGADIAYVTQISSFYPLLGRVHEGRVAVAVVPTNSKTLQYRMDFSEQSLVTSSLVGRVFNNIADKFLWVHGRMFRAALTHHYETEARITAELLKKLW